MKKRAPYRFTAEQWLPIDLQHAWRFFSSPVNLPVITPPWLDLVILNPVQQETIHEGMLIDYVVKPIAGIPLKWTSIITQVEDNKSFTDTQLKGPYTQWQHSHIFQELEHGVLMTDEVVYQIPFGSIGALMHRLFIRSRIESIFAYRRQTLHKMFTA